jgi:hypothetical protein
MASATVEQAFFESILQVFEQSKIDALALLRLQIQCSHIKTFPEFCNTLAVEQWSDPIRVDMLQWQKALGLSSEDFYFVMNLPLTKLTTALQTQNLSRILDAAEAVNAMLPRGGGGRRSL